MKEESKTEIMNKISSEAREEKIGITVGNMRIELKDSKPNRKTLSVIVRELRFIASGEPVLTPVWQHACQATLVAPFVVHALATRRVVVAFALLMIPATTSAPFSTNWLVRMISAGITCTFASAAGLLFSCYPEDLSVGPPVALFLGGILLIVGIAARIR